ncbi:MAG TPA: hypothetical protein VFX25_05460 [Streptosporangiaceae bacterium]|nr:hypothetical protein [Streptosporangiaceae bacterium]
MARSKFDYEDLDEVDPFEIDSQLTHLFKHEGMDPGAIYEVWTDNPVFYPGNDEGEADWLMVGEVTGDTVLVPLAAGSQPNKTRPIGVYTVKRGGRLDTQYRADTR